MTERHRRAPYASAPRSALALALVSTVGVVAFGWPLLADPGSDLAHSGDAPLLFALLLPLLLGVLLAEIADGGIDAKAVALLGVLAAAGAALRPLGGGITGFSPVFVLIILGGRVLRPRLRLPARGGDPFASALLTGGVGPWLPFQMLGAAWVGFGAGCLPPARGRREVWMVATYGALAGIAYGFLLNLWFWPFTGGLASGLDFVAGAPLRENLARFLAFCLATSLGFDLVRAVGTLRPRPGRRRPAACARSVGRRGRAAFEAPVQFAPADRPAHARAPADGGRAPRVRAARTAGPTRSAPARPAPRPARDGVVRGQTAALVDDVLLLDCGPEAPRAAARRRPEPRPRHRRAAHALPPRPHRPGRAALAILGQRTEEPITVHGPAGGARRVP